MKVLIASDHAGYALKEMIKQSTMTEWIDLGPQNNERVDYPDFAKKLCEEFLDGDYAAGILICGSGQGMAMAANKFKGIRAALVWSKEIAELSRSHNNANILCLPARFVDDDEATKIVESFLNTEFEGGRHLARVNKIED